VKDLINKKYPIKDTDGNVVDYKLITTAYDLENVAGVVIGLAGREPSILISYPVAYSLIAEEQK
jgi:hypothetical protein